VSLVVLVLWWPLGTAILHAFLFHPSQAGATAALPTGIERVRYGDGQRLNGYFVHASAPRRTIVFFHGNAGDAWHALPLAQSLAMDGSDVMLAEYRGYGGSNGWPSAFGVREDGEAAMHYLLAERHVDPSHLVVTGQSLGGAVAIDALAHHRVAAGVLFSTFTTLHDMSRAVIGFPLSWTVPDAWAFDSRDALAHVHAPLAFFHGDADELIPLTLARELYAAAPAPKELTVVHGGTHNLGNLDGMIDSAAARLVP